MAACDTCYRRKVRCDYETKGPCAACGRAGVACTFLLAERHKERRRTRRRSQHLPAQRMQESSTPTHALENTQPVVRRSSRRLANGLDTQGNEIWPSERLHQQNMFEEEPVPHGVPHERPDTGAYQPPLASVATTGKEEETKSSGKTILAQFRQHSINTSLWRVFDDIRNMRIAYIGSPISNLSKVVEDEVEFNGARTSSLHFPFPSIRPLLPWKPSKHNSSVQSYSESFIDDLSYLPPEELRAHLIDVYFDKIHPGFPIINESQFRAAYNDPIRDNNPPLLLLQAVLLVGAHASDHPRIEKSRFSIQRSIFRRAKALFEARYENDRVHLVQAALLFTWYADGADDVSANAYYWVGVACRIAFGLGMHRDLGKTSTTRMPLDDRRIYRRIWWTLVQLDALVSLHHGRPLMILDEDCDQPALEDDDFIEVEGLEKNHNIDVDYCLQNACLCEIIKSILRLSSPGAARQYRTNSSLFESRRSTIDIELSNWYLRLPARLKDYNGTHATFWSLQLQLHYNMTLLHLHRLHPTMPNQEGTHISETHRDICRSSAHSISNIVAVMISSNRISQCWFTCLTSLLAAAIQLCFEARSAARLLVSTLEIQAQNHLVILLDSAATISRYWPSAEAILHLYKTLLEQLTRNTNLNAETQNANNAALPQPQDAYEQPLALPEDSEDWSRQQSIQRFEEELTALFGAGETHDIRSYYEPGIEDSLDQLWEIPNS